MLDIVIHSRKKREACTLQAGESMMSSLERKENMQEVEEDRRAQNPRLALSISASDTLNL